MYRSRESNCGIVMSVMDIGQKAVSDTETVRECMLASAEEVVTDEKTRKSIIDSIKQIPIWEMPNMRKGESLPHIEEIWPANYQGHVRLY